MLNALSKQIFTGNAERGFWDLAKANDQALVKATKIALIHSEASEMLEEVRRPSDPKLMLDQDPVPMEHEELADIIIRCLDYAGYYAIDLDGIIKAKLEANAKRGFRHGGKAF